MRQQISGWGKAPVIESDVQRPESLAELQNIVREEKTILARGAGRSYGDASLHSTTIDMTRLDRLLRFNATSGILKAEGGLLLGELLKVIVPKGYFVHVTPGTKYVTLSGCVASNIHGKNHHQYGSFSESVRSLEIVTADGTLVHCSREEHPDLFWGTLGGMGLTGVVYSIELVLKKIPSAYLEVKHTKCTNLDMLFATLAQSDNHEYSVCWLDAARERGVVITGDHTTGAYDIHRDAKLPIPFTVPRLVLNRWTISIFNRLYYYLNRTKKRREHYDSFFYPLDRLQHWNRLYGKRGFTQYQLVIPPTHAKAALKEIFTVLRASNGASFLTVLKKFKDEDAGPLSFPMKGYTLNLDFPLDARSRVICKKLDSIVQKHKGRLYLTKDILMTQQMLREGYPHLDSWKQTKRQWDPDHTFTSLQAERLGL